MTLIPEAGRSRVDRADIGRVFREESGRAVATLVRAFGDIDLAEEVVQEAFVEAVRRWPEQGQPPSPTGWIMTTARNRAIDRLRREGKREQRHAEAAILHDGGDGSELMAVEDDRLRLIFTCCHPALARSAQVALTLRLLGGLTTPEIARAFLVPEPTMAQRLVRAKKKIRVAKIPYRIPEKPELPERLPPVLAVIYLTYNEGYAATGGDGLIREELCREAIRLARLLNLLMPDEPEVMGLLALLLLTESRAPARTDSTGSLVTLVDQDRSMWDRNLISEGQDLVRRCLARNQPGPYQIQAAINAVHSEAAESADTDRVQILQLYDQLLEIAPTSVIQLNRAVAVAEVEGPAAALDIIDGLSLEGYHLFHSTRGEMLSRLGRPNEAAAAFRQAAELATNATEKRHLRKRLRALTE